MSFSKIVFFPNEKVSVSWKSFFIFPAPPHLFFFTRNLFRYNIVYLRRSSTSESGGRREASVMNMFITRYERFEGYLEYA
jgi:hypothetical protein